MLEVVSLYWIKFVKFMFRLDKMTVYFRLRRRISRSNELIVPLVIRYWHVICYVSFLEFWFAL